MQRFLPFISCLAAIGCSTTTTDVGGGGQSATTGVTTTAGTGSSSSNSTVDHSGCIDLVTEADCLAGGCIYRSATLFRVNQGGAPTCVNGEAVQVCTYYADSPFQSISTFRRDTPLGRIAMTTPVTTMVVGFERCMDGTDNLCSCF